MLLFLFLNIDINPCDDEGNNEDYCLNGGSCHFNGITGECDCELGFDGDHCETGRHILALIRVDISAVLLNEELDNDNIFMFVRLSVLRTSLSIQ